MKQITRHIRIKNSVGVKRGFTAAEMIVVIAILSVVSLVVSRFAFNVISYNSSSQNNLTAQLEGRKLLKNMMLEMRTMLPSAFGAYPIELVGTSTVVFFSNISGSGSTERIRYFLDPTGKKLMKGITPYANGTYNPASETFTTLISDLANGTSTPIFTFYDSSYTGTSSPLTSPVDISRIRLIRATINIDKDAIKSPDTLELTSVAELRNLKDNL